MGTKKTLNCYISFFLPNKDANLDKNDAVSRRAASLFRNPSQYISSLFFEQKKLPANSTDSNKVAPKKKHQKNHYGIPRPTINFCLQNYRHSFMISAIINHTIKPNFLKP